VTEVPAVPIRVLLVEDSEVYRDSLVFLLGTRAGLDVVAAVPDGASAVRAHREHEPDVVVLDYRLPDVDGATVAAEIRDDGPNPAAVVFLSASAGADEYDAASSAGAALVRKDEGIDALVRAVRAAVGR
jgi:DNA-binding NarL/FixJ family response regulator